MAKEQMRQAEKQHEVELEALERARYEQAEQAERHAALLERQREAVEEAAFEARIAAAEAADEHRRTTANAWKLQSQAKSERAHSLHKSGMFQEAYKLALQAIEQDPGNFNGFWVATASLLALHDTYRARLTLEKQIQLLNLPEYQRSLGHFCSVVQLLSSETDLFPLRDAFSSTLRRNLGAWFGHSLAADRFKLIDLLIQLNMLSDAQLVLEQVLQMPGSEGITDAGSAKRLSQVLIARGNADEAIKSLQMLLQVDSQRQAVLEALLATSKGFLSRGDTGAAMSIAELLSKKSCGLLGETFLQEMNALSGKGETRRVDAFLELCEVESRQKIESDVCSIIYMSEHGELSKETVTSVMQSVCHKYAAWKSKVGEQLRDRAAADAKSVDVKIEGGWIVGVLSFVVLIIAALGFCISHGFTPDKTGAVFPMGSLLGAILIGSLYRPFRKRLHIAKRESSCLASAFESENHRFANMHLPFLTPPTPGIDPHLAALAVYPAIVIVYLIGWFSMLAAYQPQQHVSNPAPAQEASIQEKSGPGYIALLGAKVVDVRFYESGEQIVPLESRSYAQQFAATNTRYIWWQMDLQYPQHSSRIDFAIEALWYNPQGKLFWRNTVNTYAEPDWTLSNYTSGWGNNAGGAFPPGTYRVVFKVGGARVATGKFRILNEQTQAQSAESAATKIGERRAYTYTNGSFTGSFTALGNGEWEERAADGVYHFREWNVDSEGVWIYLRDDSRNINVRIPVSGGRAGFQWGPLQKGGTWHDLYVMIPSNN